MRLVVHSPCKELQSEGLLGGCLPYLCLAAHPLLQAGCIPILHMRGFQKGGQLPADLVADIQGRHAA